MKYSTILIDLDDTIWDTQNNSRESFQEMYENHNWGNYFESFDEFYNIYLPINIKLWSLYSQGKIKKEELIVQRFSLPLAAYTSLKKEYAMDLNRELMERTSTKNRLIDSAKDMLEYLAPKYQLVILSNGFREVQYKKLRNSNLEKYFHHVILSDEVGVNKPHPHIFQEAMRIAKSDKRNTIMLGDSFESDIAGAHNSHIDQIWFNPENITPKGITPTFTVKSLKEITTIL